MKQTRALKHETYLPLKDLFQSAVLPDPEAAGPLPTFSQISAEGRWTSYQLGKRLVLVPNPTKEMHL